MPIKSDHWRQPNPVMQLTAVRASLEGHLSNFIDGIISHEKFVERAADHLEQIKLLEDHLVLRTDGWT